MERNKTPLDELATLLKNPPHNLFVDVYNKSKKIKKESSVKKSKTKYTLNQLGKKVDQIADAVMNLTEITKNVVIRLDNLERDVKGINTRLDRVENRLDYIVTANKLKDLPKNS